MSTLSPRQTIQLLLEATGCPDNYSGEIDVVHAQNWGVRHVIIRGKTHFIDKRYKENLIPALKAIAAPVLRPGGGTTTYRLHDGISVNIRFDSYEDRKEIREENRKNKHFLFISKAAFRAALNKIMGERWIQSIGRGKSSTPLQELTNQYAKLA